jgi:hypothetical protein
MASPYIVARDAFSHRLSSVPLDRPLGTKRLTQVSDLSGVFGKGWRFQRQLDGRSTGRSLGVPTAGVLAHP